MIKKILVSISISLSLTLGVGGTALAQIPSTTSNPINQFGTQQHWYSVYFRGNGEAIASARFSFYAENDNQNEFKLKTNGEQLESLRAYQITSNEVCRTYRYIDPTTNREVTRSYLPSTSSDVVTDYVCLSYDNQYDLFNDTVSTTSNNVSYNEIEVAQDNDNLIFKLSESLNKEDKASIFIIYSTFDYASKKIGRYDYIFKTFASNERVAQANIAVSFDTELFVKYDDSGTNYTRTASSSPSPLSEGASMSLNASDSSGLSRYVNYTGQQGNYTKQAKAIGQNETYEVTGSFSESNFMLNLVSNLQKLLIIAVIVATFIVLIKFAIKKGYLKKRKSKIITSDTTTQNPKTSPLNSNNTLNQTSINESVSAPQITTMQTETINEPFLTISIAEIIAASIGDLMFVLILLFARSESFQDIADGDTLFGSLLMIVIVLGFIIGIIGPSIYSAIARGKAGFLRCVIWQFIILTFIVIVGVVLFGSGGSEPRYDYFHTDL